MLTTRAIAGQPGDAVFEIWATNPDGAQEKTRTSTTLRSLAPEASASTNSATWAVTECIGGYSIEDIAVNHFAIEIDGEVARLYSA
jgi:hypothetical protein